MDMKTFTKQALESATVLILLVALLFKENARRINF